MTRQKISQCLSAALAATGLLFTSACTDAQVVRYEPVPVYTQTYAAGQPVYVQPTYGAPVQSPAPVAGTTTETGAPRLAAEQLDALTAPIALYPDPLLAQLLPAATYPDDIVAANDWLQRNSQPREEDINAQGWDASVKALVHYPAAFNLLAGNIQWTQTLGAAFINQQQDVMDSIQRLRLQAQAAGNLTTTAQQEVVASGGYVEILPTDTQYLYVPVYDPYVVYVRPAVFSYDPCFIGGWLSFGFDWHRHHISRGWDWSHHRGGWDRDRDHRWDGRRGDWDRNVSADRTTWTRDSSRRAPTVSTNVVANRTNDWRRVQSTNVSGRTQTSVPRDTRTQFRTSPTPTQTQTRSSDWRTSKVPQLQPRTTTVQPPVRQQQPVYSAPSSGRSAPDIRSIPSSTPRQMPSWSNAAPQRTVQPRTEPPRAAPAVNRPSQSDDHGNSGQRGRSGVLDDIRSGRSHR